MGAGAQQCGSRRPAYDVRPAPRAPRDDVCRVRTARTQDRHRDLGGPARMAAARSGALRLRRRARHGSQPVPEQGHAVLPRAGARSGRRAVLRGAAPADVGPRLDPRRRGNPPSGGHHRRPARHLDQLRARRRGRGGHQCARPVARSQVDRHERVPLRGAEDRRRAAPDPRARGLAAHPPRRDGRARRGDRPAATRELRCRGPAAVDG